MLIATLPPVHQEDLLQKIIAHPLIACVRYNTGVDSPLSAYDTLAAISEHTGKAVKPLYVDIKGRQLKIAEWATLPYGPILLNHNIKVELPAQVWFRGDDVCELKKVVDGNKIYVDPLPRYPVGRGQSINIISARIEIEGNLTENDSEYINAAARLGISRFMLSFVESSEYIEEFEKTLQSYGGHTDRKNGYELVLKIESRAGVDFVAGAKGRYIKKYRLMAARDDLMIQIGVLNMFDALRTIVARDANAICASRLMMGLENGAVSMSDMSDIRLMQLMGYKHFMLSDGISRNHFEKAVDFWEGYIARYAV